MNCIDPVAAVAVAAGRAAAAALGRVVVAYSLHRNSDLDRLDVPRWQQWRDQAPNRSIIQMRYESK